MIRCPRRMLSDLAIGWLQEEVLLQMYARFAMQPATIPDVAAGWEQPPGSDEAQSRRRRLAVSATADPSTERRQRHGNAGGWQTVDAGRGRGIGSSGGGNVSTALPWRSRSSRRSGWRYRRRKAADGKRHAGRSLAQSSDAVSKNTAAAGAAALDQGWQQTAVEIEPHNRRRQRQHQQQEQEARSEAGTSQYSSEEVADSSLEALYPELPPPMFEQNAGADARRYCFK